MANQDIIKKSIAEAMKELVRKKHIEDISVAEICQHSNINVRTFYRYFSDKFEVIEWILYTDFLQNIQIPSKSGLYYIVSASINLVLNDREYYINGLKYRGQNSLRQYTSHHLSNLYYPIFRKCFSSDELYHLYINHAIELGFDFMEQYLIANQNSTEKEFLQAFRDFLYYPSKQFYELFEQEYEHQEGDSPYKAEEPSRVQKNGKGAKR